MGEKALNILAGLITVALVMVLVTSRQTPNVIRAFGSAFAGAVRAATGRS